MFKNIKPFIVMDILKKASSFENAIHLEIGEPDLAPSPKVLEAINSTLEKGYFGYTEAKGLSALREAIAKHYKYFYNVDISPERIIITTGSSGGFSLVFGLLEGKKVALQDPGYPCYENIAYAFDKSVVKIPVFKDTSFQVTKEHLEGLDFDLLLISSVSNPTGVVYDESNLKDVVEFCRKNNKVFVCDEIYHGLVYDKSIKTALSFDDNVFVVNSFSKFFCMPGFRIGWMIVPEKYVESFERLSQNMFISAPTLSQYAALEAFDYDYLSFVVNTFKQRRDFLYNELKNIFDIPVKPEGAFYIWANISKYGMKSKEFCDFIFDKTKVAITPGIDFGTNQTDNFVRFSFAKDINQLKEAIVRIKNML
ncbi:pyridoxal phosphate-dependent aminotransferase [Hydrogenobaculum acidophilum]